MSSMNLDLERDPRVPFKRVATRQRFESTSCEVLDEVFDGTANFSAASQFRRGRLTSTPSRLDIPWEFDEEQRVTQDHLMGPKDEDKTERSKAEIAERMESRCRDCSGNSLAKYRPRKNSREPWDPRSEHFRAYYAEKCCVDTTVATQHWRKISRKLKGQLKRLQETIASTQDTVQQKRQAHEDIKSRCEFLSGERMRIEAKLQAQTVTLALRNLLTTRLSKCEDELATRKKEEFVLLTEFRSWENKLESLGEEMEALSFSIENRKGWHYIERAFDDYPKPTPRTVFKSYQEIYELSK